MSRMVARIRDWDDHLAVDMVRRRTALLNHLMIFVTRLGDGWAWVALAAASVALNPADSRALLAPFALGLLLDIPLYLLLKHKFHRPRPYQECQSISCMLPPPDRFSFPSGHTSVAFVAFVVAGAAYPWLTAPLAALAALIGVSRVYLGVHYPSDVLAGAALGFLTGTVALWAA